MGRIIQKKILIIDPDAKGENIFTREHKRDLRIGKLVWGRIHEYMKKRGINIEGANPEFKPVLRVPDADGKDFSNLDEVKGIIIPGSVYTPTEETLQEIGWMRELIDVILKAHIKRIPMLGICFGHQAIAKAFGIEPRKFDDKYVAEIGFHAIELTREGKKDRLFHDMPFSMNIPVAFFHYYYVPELPKHAVLLARNKNCRIQAFKIGRSTWGVQFHAEYDRTNMEELIALKGDVVLRLGYVPRIDVIPTYNQMVLDKFLDFVVEH